MIIQFWLFFSYVKLLFSSKNSPEFNLAQKHFFTKHTFRFSHQDAQVTFARIRSLWRSIKRLVQAQKRNLDTAPVLIFDGNYIDKELRTHYVQSIKSYDHIAFVSRDHLLGSFSTLQKVTILPLLFLYYILTLFKKGNKPCLYLSYLEFLEQAKLFSHIKQNEVKIIHIFCPYEKDIDFISYLCIKKGITVYRHPGPTPLIAHNKHFICSVFVVCSGYQKEEISVNIPNRFWDRVEEWPPENAFEYSKHYLTLTHKTPKYQYGFYSHAGWLRHKNKTAHAVYAKLETEETLLSHLNTILAPLSQPFAIYLHPLEKKHPIQEVHEYYHRILPNSTLQFIEEPTTGCFDQVNIAFTSYSAILFERLYCGYKTIVYTQYMSHFPLENSKFSTICANNLSELALLIEVNTKYTPLEFFRNHNLDAYVFFGLDLLKNIPHKPVLT